VPSAGSPHAAPDPIARGQIHAVSIDAASQPFPPFFHVAPA
jgi:hypothetical protein